MPQFLNSTASGFEAAFTALLGQKREDSPDVDDVVAAIIAKVRARGDAALIGLPAVAGVLFGTWLQQRVPVRAVELLFAGVLVVTAVHLVLQ